MIEISTYKPKRAIPTGTFSIQWSMTSSLSDRDYIEDAYVDYWYGNLLFHDFFLGGNCQAKKIGTIELIKVDRKLDVQDYKDVLGYHSGELEAFADLFDADGELCEGVRNDVGDEWDLGSMLYVKRILVDKEYRGLGLGLFLVDEACRKINCYESLTFLIACPTEKLNVDDDDSQQESIRRLRAYYSLLGFRPLGDLFLARWNGYMWPSLKKVCPHLH